MDFALRGSRTLDRACHRGDPGGEVSLREVWRELPRYSISWLAAHGPAEAIRETLGLRVTGEQLEMPEAPIVGAALGTGWYLVMADRADHALIDDSSLKLLSADADIIACSIEEHVMCSSAALWSGGSRVWSVMHDAQRAIDHLDATGQLPAFFPEVRDQGRAQQAAEGGAGADVDFVFDVPLETARRITGFRHDAGGGPARFDVLEPVSSSIINRSRARWKFW